MRTVASQMKDAVGNSVTIRIGGAAARPARTSSSPRAAAPSPSTASSRPTSRAPTTRRKQRDDTETRLPSLGRGRRGLGRLGDRRRATRPSRRRATPRPRLIKELEEREIGRPSTYASIIGTILNRGYVYKKGTALVPTWLAFSVDPAARGALLPAGRLRVHRPDGGRPRRDRRRSQATASPSSASSTSAPTGSRACTALVTEPRRDRRPGAGDLPDRRPRLGHRPAGGPLRPVPRGARRGRYAGRQARQRARRPAARRADPGEGQGAARQPGRRGDPRSAPTPRPACRSSPRTAASAPTSPRCCPRTPPSRPSRAPARCSSR